MSTPPKPAVLLGTAMWGWTVPEARAFALLDRFYERGFRRIDAATNYPLNGNSEDFRASEQILLRWLEKRGVEDLHITMKVGSLINVRIPEHNLLPAFLHLQKHYYGNLFGSNLACLMIHWDNRLDEPSIRSSLETLAEIQRSGLSIGFSGLKHPQIHAGLCKELGLDPAIQIKHNLSYSDYPRYSDFHGQSCFYTYGINAGGWKATSQSYRSDSSLAARGGDIHRSPQILLDLERISREKEWKGDVQNASFLNQLAMTFALGSPDIGGILIGPSRLDQLESSLDFYTSFQAGDHAEKYEQLLTLHRQYAPSDRHI